VGNWAPPGDGRWLLRRQPLLVSGSPITPPPQRRVWGVGSGEAGASTPLPQQPPLVLRWRWEGGRNQMLKPLRPLHGVEPPVYGSWFMVQGAGVERDLDRVLLSHEVSGLRFMVHGSGCRVCWKGLQGAGCVGRVLEETLIQSSSAFRKDRGREGGRKSVCEREVGGREGGGGGGDGTRPPPL
jgi:hypothetical protein